MNSLCESLPHRGRTRLIFQSRRERWEFNSITRQVLPRRRRLGSGSASSMSPFPTWADSRGLDILARTFGDDPEPAVVEAKDGFAI